MKLALLGDIALFGNMSISKNKNWKSYFSEVEQVLSGVDYVVGNLETPFSNKKKTHGAKSAYICSDTENVEILKFLHINALHWPTTTCLILATKAVKPRKGYLMICSLAQ